MYQITINSPYSMLELIELFNHEKHIKGINNPDTLEDEVLNYITEKIQMKISEITIFGNPLKYQILENGFNLTGEAHSKTEAEKIVSDEKLTFPNSIFSIELLS